MKKRGVRQLLIKSLVSATDIHIRMVLLVIVFVLGIVAGFTSRAYYDNWPYVFAAIVIISLLVMMGENIARG